MKKKLISKNNKFYTTLIKNYVLFTLSTIIIIFIVLFIGIFKLLGLVNFMSYDKTISDQIDLLKKGDYSKINIDYLKEENGWLEILDENYKVIYTKGIAEEKKDSYTKSELDAISKPELFPYYVNKQSFKDNNGKELIAVTKVPKEVMDTNEISTHVSKGFVQLLILFALLYTINIVFFIMWLNRRVKKPLYKINSAMNSFTKENKEIHLDYKGDEEFAQICNSFNHMIKTLKKVEKEKELLEKSKQKMLADISHDLKTPITTIQGYSKAISSGYVSNPEDINKYLNIIYKKSTKVTDLINLLFEYVKLGHPDFKLKLSSDDLCEFMRDIIAENYEYLDDRGFILEFSIPEEELYYNFDKSQLKRAVSNLISNSIKYNDSGTTLKIVLEDNPSYYLLTIADNGIGIPEEIKSDIFVPFVIGDESRSSCGGTGLGLSITKQIIEKHGGEINLLSSDKSNFVTEFQIKLPKN